MPTRFPWAVALVLPLAGCSSAVRAPSAAEAPAIHALQRGDFEGATHDAERALGQDPDSARAALVRALTRYRKTMHQFGLDARTVALGGAMAGAINHRYLRTSLEESEAALGRVEGDLAVAAKDPNLTLELCVACWEIDWNGNGRIDDRDRVFFQIEQDADGKPIPEDDPRRKPTFRFDHGDVEWARAFVAFQRAAMDLLLAYDFSAADRLLDDRHDTPRVIRIPLTHRERVRAARELLLAGLEHSEASRKAYLAEKDDDREWVPNPSQKSHPLPLPVDAALYETWHDVVGDLERLVKGEEGLSVAEVMRLDGDLRAERAPSGYLDIGRMLSDPKDIVIDLGSLKALEGSKDTDAQLRAVFGQYYVRHMKASPLPRRLLRMKDETERGTESLERKLRYLIWIN